MKHDTDDYIRVLTGPYSSPRFVLDHVPFPNKGGVLAAVNSPLPGGAYSSSWRQRSLPLQWASDQRAGHPREWISDSPVNPGN
jgi:hypothetical protein